MTTSIHVIPHTSGWAVRRKGALRSIRTFRPDQRVEAIVFAARLSGDAGIDLYVHSRDGMIEATVPA